MHDFEKPMTFNSLDAIQKHSFVGNAWMDMSAFNAIEAFARDTTRSMYDRAEALRIMGREGMGLDPEDNSEHLSDEALVTEFLESADA